MTTMLADFLVDHQAVIREAWYGKDEREQPDSSTESEPDGQGHMRPAAWNMPEGCR